MSPTKVAKPVAGKKTVLHVGGSSLSARFAEVEEIPEENSFYMYVCRHLAIEGVMRALGYVGVIVRLTDFDLPDGQGISSFFERTKTYPVGSIFGSSTNSKGFKFTHTPIFDHAGEFLQVPSQTNTEDFEKGATPIETMAYLMYLLGGMKPKRPHFTQAINLLCPGTQSTLPDRGFTLTLHPSGGDGKLQLEICHARVGDKLPNAFVLRLAD
jgi:hypothetical protein